MRGSSAGLALAAPPWRLPAWLLDGCSTARWTGSTPIAAGEPPLGMRMIPAHGARSPLPNAPTRALYVCHCCRLWLEGVWSYMLCLVSAFLELPCAVHRGVRSAYMRGAGMVLLVGRQVGCCACLRRRPATMATRPWLAGRRGGRLLAVLLHDDLLANIVFR